MSATADARKPIDLVIASAGTGKTFRLIEEVQKAIDAGAATSSIMATTFTNKAAAELVERARSKLIGEGKADQAAGLLSARVGTVNSVFGKIVGEFALNAGRSPVADVIPEERQARMFAISAEEAIARRAGEVIPVAQRLEIENWEDDVRRLADLARQNDIDGVSLEDHAQRSWSGLRAIFPEPPQETGSSLNTSLQVALAEVEAQLEGGSDTTKATAGVKQQIAEASAVFQSGRDLSWASWARLAKLKPANSSVDIVRPVVDIAMQHAAHPGLHADLKAYIRGVYRAASAALNVYADYKAANGLVDFIDQEHEALRLLDAPEVAGRLRETLSRVFVDEFQDTSPIQLALFLKISQIADRSFWVGDPKQAIYGFRGTDPGLIEKAAAEVVPKSGGKRDTLATSYRARGALVEFTNSLFAPAFETLGFEPGTVRIEQCHRGDSDAQPQALMVWGVSGSRMEVAMAAVAEQIRQVLENPETHVVEDRAQAGPRPIRGSDIGVLCRSNQRCAELAAALAEAGIQVSIARPGLLDTPEAALAVAALRFLVDPSDSLAIAEVAHLFDDAEGQPAWFERSLSEAGVRSLVAELPVLAALEAARAELVELTPREALESAITASGVLDRVHAWGDALDRLTNLDALRGLADQYEGQARTLRSAATAAGLVAWLAGSAQSSNDLPPSTDPAAVNVLTYHRAKGLEWPMVVLLDLDNARQPSAFGLNVEAAEDFDIWQPLSGRWVRFWPWPYGRQSKNVHIDSTVLQTDEYRAAARREHAEAVRLLYVGMTRARDYLVLAPRESESKGFQLRWLDRLRDLDGNTVLDASRLAAEGTLTVGGRNLPAAYVSAHAGEGAPPGDPDTPGYRLPEAPAQPDRPPYRIVPSEHVVPTERARDDALARHDTVEYPASADSPGVAVARVVARVELGARIPISGSPDMSLLGEAVHAFLAFDRPGRNLDDRRERARRTLTRWSVGGLDPDHLVEMGDRLFTHLEAACPDMRIRTEVPVFARRDGQRLSGRIDLLLTGEARAVVIDHKSYPGAFDTWEGRALRHAGQLALYAAVIREAADCTEVQTWVHLPVVGQLIEVKTDSGIPAATIQE